MHLFGRDSDESDSAARRPFDPRRRMRLCLLLFVAGLALVWLRMLHLELSHGAEYRLLAQRPLERQSLVPGVRGRILTRDGVVLAADHQALAVAMHYRWLQQPAAPAWLRRMARAKLVGAERRNPQRLAAEEARVIADREAVAARLRQLCDLSDKEWQRRTTQIQTRVERIAQSANRRQEERAAGATPPDSAAEEGRSPAADWRTRIVEFLRGSMPPSRPARITVAEELDYHVVADEVPLAVVAEIEAHPDQYPGVKIVERPGRRYPAGTTAAHVLGHLGPRTADDPPPTDAAAAETLIGRAGVERQYETLLAGSPGVRLELTDHTGRVLTTYRRREPGLGRDVVLTLDSQLQTMAEGLLDQALRRRAITAAQDTPPPGGGAIVVLDVRDGAILALAAAPRFDPAWFASGATRQVAAVLRDPAHPLFNRAVAMALPPGSTFKIVTAAALLQSPGFDPRAELDCRGYLDDPEHWRCALYQHTGQGHGPTALEESLMESCNVYFFQHARQQGPTRIVDWALRFGLGRATGVDLPGEAAGGVPLPRAAGDRAGGGWQTADTLALSIGQSTLMTTPVQMACLIAAVANGGQLVQPHVVRGLGLVRKPSGDAAAEADDDPVPVRPPQPIAGLRPETLAAIRRGLERVVEDPAGTAFASVRLDDVRIAGKTGTAQAGAGLPDHAWFVGYAPADEPRVAFAIALEYAGESATAAGPLAKRLVQQLRERGMLGMRRSALE